MKKADYWKSSIASKIRKQILTKEWIGKNSSIETLSKLETDLLNKEIIKNSKTVLTTEGILSGSHSTGSEQKKSNTPFLVFDKTENRKNDNLNYCRFINFFKPLKLTVKNIFNPYSQINKDVLSHENSDKFISLKEYLNKFSEYRKDFYFKYNYNLKPEIFGFKEKDIITYNNEINYNQSEKAKISEKAEISKKVKIINDFNKETISIIKAKYNNNFQKLNNQKLKSELRRLYSTSVDKYLNLNLLQKPSLNAPMTITEKCHIISFEYLVKEKKYEDAVSPFNVLFLNPDLHNFFDKNYLTFNPKDKKIELADIGKNKEDVKKYLSYKINVTDEQLKYIEKNYNHYKSKGFNT